jgi:hypothetical protein
MPWQGFHCRSEISEELLSTIVVFVKRIPADLRGLVGLDLLDPLRDQGRFSITWRGRDQYQLRMRPRIQALE